jgi:dihydrodipicolinate reductase
MSKIKIAVAGCLGRMGQEIIKQILQDNRINLIGCFEHKNHTDINKKISDILNIK